MIKFQIEDKNPNVLVGLVESAGIACLTLNGIKVAFLSPDTGRLGTFLLSDREERALDSLGIKIEGGCLASDSLEIRNPNERAKTSIKKATKPY